MSKQMLAMPMVSSPSSRRGTDMLLASSPISWRPVEGHLLRTGNHLFSDVPLVKKKFRSDSDQIIKIFS